MVKKNNYSYLYDYSAIFIIIFIHIISFLLRYFTQFERIIKIKKLDYKEYSKRSKFQFNKYNYKKFITILDTDNNTYMINSYQYQNFYNSYKPVPNLQINKNYMIKGYGFSYSKTVYDIEEVFT
jgi:hypothetical protein